MFDRNKSEESNFTSFAIAYAKESNVPPTVEEKLLTKYFADHYYDIAGDYNKQTGRTFQTTNSNVLARRWSALFLGKEPTS